MKSLVQIVNDVTILEQKLIESDGAITPEIEDLLVVKSELLPAKIDGYALFLDRLDALSNHYSEQADFFKNIAKQCDNVQERLKDNIKFAMKTLDVTEICGDSVRLKLQRTKPKVIITDELLIPSEYKKEVITIQVEKEKLRGDLEIGPVPGAQLEQSFSLKKYAATPSKKGKSSNE